MGKPKVFAFQGLMGARTEVPLLAQMAIFCTFVVDNISSSMAFVLLGKQIINCIKRLCNNA